MYIYTYLNISKYNNYIFLYFEKILLLNMSTKYKKNCKKQLTYVFYKIFMFFFLNKIIFMSTFH